MGCAQGGIVALCLQLLLVLSRPDLMCLDICPHAAHGSKSHRLRVSAPKQGPDKDQACVLGRKMKWMEKDMCLRRSRFPVSSFAERQPKVGESNCCLNNQLLMSASGINTTLCFQIFAVLLSRGQLVACCFCKSPAQFCLRRLLQVMFLFEALPEASTKNHESAI